MSCWAKRSICSCGWRPFASLRVTFSANLFPKTMPLSVSVKGIHEGLLITPGEGNWEEAYSSLLGHLDSKPDFFFGAQAILQLGAYPLHAAELAALRGALA